MSYFPAFIKLDNKKILIVGGGNIAFEKLKHLIVFTREIHVIAQEYSYEMLAYIKKEQLSYEKRSYTRGDIQEYGIVVVAVDSLSLQKEIFQESKKYNCLCNAVDSVEYCDFIFPSYIKRGDLTIAISTSGSSPSFAKYLRIYLESLFPSDITQFLLQMKKLRHTLPKGKERMKMLDAKAKKYIQSWKK